MQTIDGRKIRDEILAGIKDEVSKISFRPVFCDVLVGEDEVSMQYIRMKKKYAESVGMEFREANFSGNISTEDLIKEINILNKEKNMCGIIIQLPLPLHIDTQKVLDVIDPDLDVDCLGKERSDRFYAGEIEFGFPTAFACLKLLESINLSLKNKNVVVLGQGKLVGRPVTALLKHSGHFANIVMSRTENQSEIIKKADVIISGIGKGAYIKGDMIKQGAILIDAGTSEEGGGIVGDVDFESVKDVASFVSPVPGGVGPVTVAMLFKNVLEVAKSKTCG